MKKKNSLLFILLMYSLTMLAQKDITKFMGIPVDGFKKDMIQKLKAKGFEYDNEIDLLTGEFNGEKVNIFIATQSNKVWRIVVADAIERNEHDIKIRFNTPFFILFPCRSKSDNTFFRRFSALSRFSPSICTFLAVASSMRFV